MKRQFNEFLNDVVEEISFIKENLKNISFKKFKNDKLLVKGITKSLEIIGEAVSNIPDEIKSKYNYIPWKAIKDFRNVITHQYWSIDYDVEWHIIKTKLDILEKQIKEIIEKEN